ncbi:hypothetical protein RchiOBHm_Chr7g0231321 [Rosa chinensis]|uniref:Uncharacterized protein n=1 Tax=Rosa chinensis TaxID=74649 RepID=A0A2P6PFM1_ROSCH|nr:hypothetical protein RchiOBHm_Chr7g0231321 [Rosa chinensis]
MVPCLVKPIYGSEGARMMHKRGYSAVKQFNMYKNAQLEFVRVLRASMHHKCFPFYYLTLEAVDAGVLKVYQAEVFGQARVIIGRGLQIVGVKINMFGCVDDNGSLLILIDNRNGEGRKGTYCGDDDEGCLLEPLDGNDTEWRKTSFNGFNDKGHWLEETDERNEWSIETHTRGNVLWRFTLIIIITNLIQ